MITTRARRVSEVSIPDFFPNKPKQLCLGDAFVYGSKSSMDFRRRGQKMESEMVGFDH